VNRNEGVKASLAFNSFFIVHPSALSNVGGSSLRRLVRRFWVLKCVPDVSVMKHSQEESRWRENADKRTCTNQEAEV
jgi:hypothetical protein